MADEHRVTSVGVEFADEAPTDAPHRVTSVGVEFADDAPTNPPHRITALGVEYAKVLTGGPHRVTALGVEYADTPPATSPHRVTALAAEFGSKLNLPHLHTAIPKIAPTDGSKGVALVPIFEIDLKTTTLRFAESGISAEDGFVEAGVVGWGSFLRELPEQSGEFRVSEGQITLQNADNRWGVLRKSDAVYEAVCRIKIGDPTGKLSDFQTIYSGTVTDWNLEPTTFSMVITDPWTRFLDRILFIPITSFTFPFLPDSTPAGGMVPIVAGIHDTTHESERNGAIPAYLIDPEFTHIVLGADKFRYVACQGKIEGVTKVYIYGELATEGAGNDYVVDDEDAENLFAVPDVVNYITFNTDPRLGLGGTIPEGADTSIPEVTFDCKGLINEAVGGTSTMENPAEVLDFVLRKHAKSFTDAVLGLQTIDDSINTASVTKATLAFQRSGLKIAFFVTDVASTVREILNRFSESTGLTLVSRKDGSLSFVVQTQGVEGPGFYPWLIEGTHTFDEGFQVTKADQVISVLTVNYQYDVVTGTFQKTDIDLTMDGGTQGHGEAGEINLWYVRDTGSKSVAAEEFLFRAQQDRDIITIDVDPALVKPLSGFKTGIEVGEVIALTHSAIPSEDGFGSRASFYRILSVAPTLDIPMRLTLRLQDLKAFVKSSRNKAFLDLGRMFGSHIFQLDHEKIIGAAGALQESTRLDPQRRQF